MKKVFLSCLLALVPSAFAQNPAGVRILLGMTDQKSTSWDGSLTARGAEVTSLEPWRFESPDAISGNSWKASTHAARLFGGAVQFDLPSIPVVPNGVIAFFLTPGPTSSSQSLPRRATSACAWRISRMESPPAR